MPSSTGSTISLITRALDLGRDQRARRERAHAAGVRAAIVVVDALVILRRRHAHERAAVGQHEVRGLLADQELFEHDAIAGAAESPVDHRLAHRRLGGRAVLGNHDALARGETVGFHDNRKAEIAARDHRECLVRGRAVGEASGRHAVAGHEVLRERPCSTRARPPRASARRSAATAAANTSATPALSGTSGPTTVRSTCS